MASNPLIDEFDILKYWHESDRKERFKHVWLLIVSALVASLASTDVERVSVLWLAIGVKAVLITCVPLCELFALHRCFRAQRS